MVSSIAGLIACHNRRATTLGCLDALFRNRLPEGVSLKVFLVDDGSTDGTAEAVRTAWSSVEIIHGDGSLFWARATALAFSVAIDHGFDAYLWLNDDTILEPDAINTLIGAANEQQWRALVVGAVRDPQSGELTYGGARRIGGRLRPFLCELVPPNGHPQYVDVVNGNVLLIPSGAAEILGNIDGVFEHGMGDTDYSLRAGKRGVRIVLAPTYVGECSRNQNAGTYRDHSLGLKERFSLAFSRKGLPVRSWLVMCWRHGGLLWPVHFIWAYAKIILRAS
ncbi:glycosyltransferase family 2 protein [Lysobacter sp. P5_B9]